MTEILQWNCNGFRSQYEELQLLVNKHMPKIITLQETRTNPSTNTTLKEYETIFSHRPSGQGGVAIAIKTGIKYKTVQLISTLEAIAVEVNIPRKMTVCSIYLSPNQQISKQEIENILDRLPKPFILSGDFNAHHNHWGSKKDDSRGKIIESIINDRNLIILNDGSPTFIHSGNLNGNSTAPSCIDLTLCSAEIADKLNWMVVDDQHGSDHFPITIGTDQHNKRNRIARWNIEKADWYKYEEEIEKLILPTTDYTIEELTEAIKLAATRSIPKTSTKTHPKAVPWWNPTVADAIKQRKKALKKKQKSNPNDPLYRTIHEEFTRARNNCRKIIKEEKLKSWEQFASSINENTPTKEIWNRIRSISKKKLSSTRTWAIATENEIISNPKDIANHLAEHFQKASSNEAYSPKFLNKKRQEESLPIKFENNRNSKLCKPYSMNELMQQLDKLTGTSPGPDDIHNAMLQRLPFYIKKKLLEAYNELWKNRTFPEAWRKSILIPIPKPGKCPNTADNLRPICLSSCVLKLFERMVNKRLMNHLETNGIFEKSQYGFRKGRQTTDVITEIDNFGRDAIRNKKQAEIIFLDLSKAYDRTWRRLILKRLKKAGISGHMAKFCNLFLERRYFQVRYEDQLSDTTIQENGVPQGSVLAVTFFLLAVDSIKDFLPKDTFIKMYADDITIAVISKSAKWTRIKTQKILDSIQKWSDETGFQISAQKSAIMHVGKRRKLQNQPPPTLNLEKITLVNNQKLLGVWIDNKFSYNYHIKITRDEVRRRLGIMNCLSKSSFGADRKWLLHILKMIILPKLLYGSPVITCADGNNARKLDPLYHQGIRFATGAFHSSPIESILSESGLPPLQLIMTQKIINYSTRQLARGILLPDTHIINKTKQLMDEHSIPHIAIEDENPNSSLSWEEQTHNVNAGIPDKLPPTAKRIQFLELCNTEYQHHYHIYTDGSKTQQGVGCSVHSNDINIALCLPPHLSIFSAEAFAIIKALEYCKRGLNVIFSDSKSVLDAVANNHCHHPWIIQIRRMLHEKQGNSALCWVPAHVNIAGNEKADLLAKDGASQKNPIEIKTPFEDFKRIANSLITATWCNTWNCSTSKLRRIKNIPFEWNSSYANDRHLNRVITRLRIGHTRLTHSHFAKKEDPAMCPSCGTRITVEHILIECRLYNKERQKNQLGTSLQEILSDDNNTLQKTINFLKDTKLHTLI